MLGLSVRTVQKRRENAKRKLGLRGGGTLLRHALQQDLVRRRREFEQAAA